MTATAWSVTGSPPELIVHPDEEALAQVTAARLLTATADAQAERGVASLVLTGGGIGIGVLKALAALPGLGAVDWTQVSLWWGDERWVADLDQDRNERQAKEALLDTLTLDPDRVHPMAGSDTTGSPEESAAAYASLLADAGPFDVCLLGVGPEGHTASMFPHSPAARERSALVVGVHDSPKPPPERVSMTLPALARSRQVWLIASGGEKADAVGWIMARAEEDAVPAAGVRGSDRTLVLVDRAAAARRSDPPTPS